MRFIANLKNYLISMRVGGLKSFCLSDKKMKADTDWSIKAMHIKTPSHVWRPRSERQVPWTLYS